MAQIGMTKLARFLRRMETGYRAGLDLRSLWRRESKGRLSAHAAVAHRVADRLDQGEDLSEAMQQTAGYFPPLVVAVVRAGDRSGRLDRSLGLLAGHYESLIATRNRFLMGIAWPVFQLVFSIFVIGALILIMDWLARMNRAQPIDWFGWGWTGGQYFLLYAAVVITAGAAIALFVTGMLKGWFGIWPLRIARRIPVVGGTIEAIALARFSWALGIAQEAGMDVVDSVKMALNATQNYYYTRHEPQIIESIRRGDDLHQSLAQTRAFSDELLTFVGQGEITGELPESLARLAGYLQEQIERNLKILSTAGFVLVFCVIAALLIAVIFFLYFRVYFGQLQQFM